jgi:hypothetical protein
MGFWFSQTCAKAQKAIVFGIEHVIAKLDLKLHPVSIVNWFTTQNPDLEVEGGRTVSPREWLIAGYPPTVVAALAERPGFDRPLSDPILLEMLKNVAIEIGYNLV